MLSIASLYAFTVKVKNLCTVTPGRRFLCEKKNGFGKSSQDQLLPGDATPKPCKSRK